MDDDFTDLMGSLEGRAMVRALRATGRCAVPMGAAEELARETAQLLHERVLPGVGPVRAWVQELRGAHHVCVELAQDA
jgi:hypothetical protein